jgi:peptidoglycan hydrolase-like protein with peptidoglycan-binding domain
VPDSPEAPEPTTRADRFAARRGRTRRLMAVGGSAIAVATAAITTVVVLSNGSNGSTNNRATRSSSIPRSTATTTTAAPTTSTVPAIRQPPAVTLPEVPAQGISWGSSGPVTLAYEQRLKQLHFDPGPVDGVFSQDTAYAVTAVEKTVGLQRDGVIGPLVRLALEHYRYQSAKPHAEGDRVEINLDTQVLTVFKDWQPILITTTSTGSGRHFCGGTDGCQYAITPAGHFHFQYLHRGWDSGKLGKMWNPYYFDGGIAVHGLQSVPPYPASHGCARIPMDIASYFPGLVTKGESVYVVGTPMKPGNGYVGPAPTTTTTAPRTTTTRKHHRATTTTRPRGSTTTVARTTTTAHTTTTK